MQTEITLSGHNGNKKNYIEYMSLHRKILNLM